MTAIKHGTTYGWKQHRLLDEAPCADCRAAVAAYEYRRSIDEALGRPRVVPSTGYVRRLRALQAIGWSLDELAVRLGTNKAVLARANQRGRYVRVGTLQRLVGLYDELCMTVPSDPYANRRRMLAAKKGYHPPLAWDDIDRDAEPYQLNAAPVIDEVAIARALSGDRSVSLERHEREEALKRHLAAGGTNTSFERLTGVRASRYTEKEQAA